jgi:hypothetical protein
MTADWGRARAIADAVLYEGYLLYPYRATSAKNRSRWQFGVLGPPGAEQAGIGENDTLSTQVLVQPLDSPMLSGVVRFLQLQHRGAQRAAAGGGFEPVDELIAGSQSWLSWDEAVECEVPFGPLDFANLPCRLDISISGGTDVEAVEGGRLVRSRRDLRGRLTISVEPEGEFVRLTLDVRNTATPAADKDEAVAASMIGTHLLVEATDGQFVSLLEPPDSAADAVATCRQHRCFPVLAGAPGERNVVLVSPIILYDHPEIAEQSEGALYDSTEIDEILTLRVMTMTDEEKAQARATDARAAAIIDRCDALGPTELQRLHGILRAPHAPEPARSGDDWWAAEAAAPVSPETDAVLVAGARVARGSLVRLHPSRRADAQDMFLGGQRARVSGVHVDLDGETHVAVTLLDDPAAELHDWYGRYLYFAPDELEPLPEASATREEKPS